MNQIWLTGLYLPTLALPVHGSYSSGVVFLRSQLNVCGAQWSLSTLVVLDLWLLSVLQPLESLYSALSLQQLSGDLVPLFQYPATQIPAASTARCLLSASLTKHWGTVHGLGSTYNATIGMVSSGRMLGPNWAHLVYLFTLKVHRPALFNTQCQKIAPSCFV